MHISVCLNDLVINYAHYYLHICHFNKLETGLFPIIFSHYRESCCEKNKLIKLLYTFPRVSIKLLISLASHFRDGMVYDNRALIKSEIFIKDFIKVDVLQDVVRLELPNPKI